MNTLLSTLLAHRLVAHMHFSSQVRGEPIQALNGMKHDSFVDLDFSGSEVIKEITVR